MGISLIGSISLNISFILYLILYIPQIIHNQKSANISQLSLSLHLLLYSSYLFDLCYGFSNQLPWQYKTVSIIGLSLVSVQHLQLIQFFIMNQCRLLANLSIAILMVALIGLYYFFKFELGSVPYQTTLILGTAARVTGLIYCLPQIIKNKTSKSAKALSAQFICLNLTLALLDTISSWCLDWGWPNKLSAPITFIMMIILLTQIKKYNFRPRALAGE
ncbi:MAG: hypothetical protein H0T84_04190 [Tatlockia sp.]|nr:hypothetical protein [Tatlockia sp.]